jgi:hypothetical protein
VYDETRTWGRTTLWPEWVDGHRQLVFANAKWAPPESLLARRPRWVVTSEMWVSRRRRPRLAHERVANSYDARLAGGRAGYVERARFPTRHPSGGSWQVLAEVRRAPAGELLS